MVPLTVKGARKDLHLPNSDLTTVFLQLLLKVTHMWHLHLFKLCSHKTVCMCDCTLATNLEKEIS